jgi:hypothetical protein
VDAALTAVPPTGEPWDRPKLAVGARLTEFFRRNGVFQEPYLADIDVTAVGRNTTDPEIVLTAIGGTKVKWGKSSVYQDLHYLTPSAGEPRDSEKLQALLQMLRRTDGLEGFGHGYLDVRVPTRVAAGTEE